MNHFTKCLITLITLLFPLLLKAQEGKQFPDIPVKALTDETFTLPAKAKGKVTLVGVAYSQKSDAKLKTWMQPIYDKFMDTSTSTGTLFVPVEAYDIDLYFVGMIKGIAKAAGEKIRTKMKNGTPKKLHEHTVTYKGSIKEYKKQLALGKKDNPYFFLLDEDGKVLYATHGTYSSSKMAHIEEAIDKHVAAE